MTSNKNTPKLILGQKVYGIYHGSILPYYVYALSSYSFIIYNYKEYTEEVREWFFDDYNKTWFTDVEIAKKTLWKLYNNDYEQYEMRKDGERMYSIYRK